MLKLIVTRSREGEQMSELEELRAENERLSIKAVSAALMVQQLQEDNARLILLLDAALKLINTSSVKR